MGEERRQKINVKKKLNEVLSKPRISICKEIDSHSDSLPSSDIECAICAEPIANYTPKLIIGEEINPACNTCSCSNDKIDKNHNPSVIRESKVGELKDELVDEMEETVEEQLAAYKEKKEYLGQHPSAYH